MARKPVTLILALSLTRCLTGCAENSIFDQLCLNRILLNPRPS